MTLPIASLSSFHKSLPLLSKDPLASEGMGSLAQTMFKDFMSNLHQVEHKVSDFVINDKDLSALIPDVARIGLEVEALKNITSELIRSTKEILSITA